MAKLLWSAGYCVLSGESCKAYRLNLVLVYSCC